jgi:hypothetical protein
MVPFKAYKDPLSFVDDTYMMKHRDAPLFSLESIHVRIPRGALPLSLQGPA